MTRILFLVCRCLFITAPCFVRALDTRNRVPGMVGASPGSGSQNSADLASPPAQINFDDWTEPQTKETKIAQCLDCEEFVTSAKPWGRKNKHGISVGDRCFVDGLTHKMWFKDLPWVAPSQTRTRLCKFTSERRGAKWRL